jgi:hypothetical protein
MEAKGVRGKTYAELAAAVEQAMEQGFAPNLAIVFGSAIHDLAAVRAIFADAGIDLFGASTAGEILATGSDECVSDQSLVALLLTLDRAAYRLHLFDAHARSPYAAGQDVGQWARGTFANPAVLIMISGAATADGLPTQIDCEQVVSGIVSAAGERMPIYGCGAGDDLQFSETVVFTNEGLSSQSVLALSLDQAQVEVHGVVAGGWQPVGMEMTITSAEANIVHTIDHMSALTIYNEYLGLTEDSEIKLLEYPLHVVRPEGYAVLRSPFLPLQHGSLLYAGTVSEGSRVLFSASPGPEIIDQALEVIRGLHHRATEADALVLFSCVCRHLALGPMAEDEIQPMQQLWNAPLIGLYCYGEIGATNLGRCDFHNAMYVLVTLKER